MPPKAAPKAAPKPAAPAKKAPAPSKAPEKKAPAAAEKKPEAPKPKAATPSCNGIHVKNWGKGSSEDASKLFANCGKVTDVRIRRNHYALVWFDNAAAVKKAVDTFNNKEIDGKALQVAPAKSTPVPPKINTSMTVFVKPIFRDNTTRAQLRELFGGCGKIIKITQLHLNKAFVYFDSVAAAQKAIKEKNGFVFRNKTLTVKPSIRTVENDKKRYAACLEHIAVHKWKKQQVHGLA